LCRRLNVSILKRHTVAGTDIWVGQNISDNVRRQEENNFKIAMTVYIHSETVRDDPSGHAA
jgi:hypothetical protein